MIARVLKLALLAGAGMAAWKAMQPRQSGPFFERALRDGVAEVQAARSAQLRGASAELRRFAQQLEHDHAGLNARLAEAGGLQVPEPDTRQQTGLARIDACQGEAYDRAWLRHMARGHARAIRMFQREVDIGGVGASLAAQALPTLRGHARRIDALREPGGTRGVVGAAARAADDGARATATMA
jgi:putative membrane protein